MSIGIGLIVIGEGSACMASRKMDVCKNEIDTFPDRKKSMMLRRNYCRLTIIAGIVILMIAIAV